MRRICFVYFDDIEVKNIYFSLFALDRESERSRAGDSIMELGVSTVIDSERLCAYLDTLHHDVSRYVVHAFIACYIRAKGQFREKGLHAFSDELDYVLREMTPESERGEKLFNLAYVAVSIPNDVVVRENERRGPVSKQRRCPGYIVSEPISVDMSRLLFGYFRYFTCVYLVRELTRRDEDGISILDGLTGTEKNLAVIYLNLPIFLYTVISAPKLMIRDGDEPKAVEVCKKIFGSLHNNPALEKFDACTNRVFFDASSFVSPAFGHIRAKVDDTKRADVYDMIHFKYPPTVPSEVSLELDRARCTEQWYDCTASGERVCSVCGEGVDTHPFASPQFKNARTVSDIFQFIRSVYDCMIYSEELLSSQLDLD